MKCALRPIEQTQCCMLAATAFIGRQRLRAACIQRIQCLKRLALQGYTLSTRHDPPNDLNTVFYAVCLTTKLPMKNGFFGFKTKGGNLKINISVYLLLVLRGITFTM
jgi:hypothetical protein